MSGFVYFVKPVGQDGPIKVGHSAFPPERLGTLQTWSPVELELVSSFSAPRSVETFIHERFARWQVRGEWFEPVEGLVALMRGIEAGRQVSDLVDLSIKTGKLKTRPKNQNPISLAVGAMKRRVDRARTYASGVDGVVCAVPENIRRILASAGGYRQPYRPLTEGETAAIEEFIAHCRRPRATRQGEAAA